MTFDVGNLLDKLNCLEKLMFVSPLAMTNKGEICYYCQKKQGWQGLLIDDDIIKIKDAGIHKLDCIWIERKMIIKNIKSQLKHMEFKL